MGAFERECEGRKSERKVGKWGRAAGFHAHGQCMKINSVCVPYTALSPSTLQGQLSYGVSACVGMCMHVWCVC